MRKLLLAFVAAIAGLVVVAPSPARAGGWAVVSFDALPRLVPGEQATVTFRVLQHGVTPVDPERWGGTTLALRVAGADEIVDVPATPTGTPGQLAATFTVPEGASVGLEVRWDGGLMFEEPPIRVPTSEGTATGPARWVPLAFAAATVGGLALVASELTSRRRTRTTPDDRSSELVPA